MRGTKKGVTKAEIIRLRKENKTYNEIAKILGCAKATISYHCTKEGLVDDYGAKYQTIDEAKKSEINAYAKNHTIKETINNLKVGRSTVKRYKTKQFIIAKKVGQYTLDGKLIKIWNSTAEIGRETDFVQSTVKNVCGGFREKAYGFIWKYEK